MQYVVPSVPLAAVSYAAPVQFQLSSVCGSAAVASSRFFAPVREVARMDRGRRRIEAGRGGQAVSQFGLVNIAGRRR